MAVNLANDMGQKQTTIFGVNVLRQTVRYTKLRLFREQRRVVWVDRRFRGAYCLHHHLLWDYMTLYLRRLSYSYSLSWEPEISLSTIHPSRPQKQWRNFRKTQSAHLARIILQGYTLKSLASARTLEGKTAITKTNVKIIANTETTTWMLHYKKTGQHGAPLYENWTTGCSIIRKLDDWMLH
jgi:hypothetical protein